MRRSMIAGQQVDSDDSVTATMSTQLEKRPRHDAPRAYKSMG